MGKSKYFSFLFISLFFIANKAWSENPSTQTVNSIDIKGFSSDPTFDPREILPFKPGDDVSVQDIRLGKEILISELDNRGHREAVVTGSLNQGLVIYRITPGPTFYFGPTKVEGPQHLPLKVFDIERTYSEGDLYSSQKLYETQSRLYRTGLIKDLRIQTSTAPNHVVPITIQAQENKHKWIKGGVGWGSEEKERFRLSLEHKNLWHSAHQATLNGTVSRIWEEYELAYKIPYFLKTRTEQLSSLSWRHEDREGYDFERILGAYGFGRQLTKAVHGSLYYNLNRNITYHVDPGIAATTPDRTDGRSLSISFNRDRTNDLFYPSNGTRSLITLERSGGVLGGNLDFNRVSTEGFAYRKIWKELVTALALRFGYVHEYGESEDVPIYERFFTGGANSVRGYEERDVGPQDADGNPLGGRWKFGATTEFRYPLFWKFSGAIFIDGGQVGPDSKDVDISNWRWGTGTGIRLKTPIGPIRLDYGYKLNPQDTEKDRGRFHFSLGESF